MMTNQYQNNQEIVKALYDLIGFSDKWEIKPIGSYVYVRNKLCKPCMMSRIVLDDLRKILSKCWFFIELHEDNNLWLALYV